MKVSEAYQKFSTPKNLQEHMLRVSSLSKIITDNWTGSEIDKTAVVAACSIHDITKPISFDLTKQAEYGMSQEEIDNLKDLQIYIRKEFGVEEHRAVTELGKSIGMSLKATNVLDNLEWKFIPRLLSENNYEALIAVYSDMRISPKGIMSLEKRVHELESRYGKSRDFEYVDFKLEGTKMEKELAINISFDLDSVTDEKLNSIFPDILNLEL